MSSNKKVLTKETKKERLERWRGKRGMYGITQTMKRVSFSRRESFIFLNNAAKNLNTHNHKHWSHLLFYFSKVSFNIMMGNKGPEWCELKTKKKGRRVEMDKQLLWDTWLWRKQRKLGTVVKDVVSGKNFSCFIFFSNIWIFKMRDTNISEYFYQEKKRAYLSRWLYYSLLRKQK